MLRRRMAMPALTDHNESDEIAPSVESLNPRAVCELSYVAIVKDDGFQVQQSLPNDAALPTRS